MKRFFKAWSLLTVMVLAVALSTAGFASAGVRYDEHAEVLKSLGLFSGTNNGFELERAPKRVEVAAMLVKFLGAEAEANAMKYRHPFTDVPEWANNFVGYMYEKGLTTGIGNNMFGSSKTASAKDYSVFLLKALGYDMNDFEYANTMAFAVKSGLFSEADRADVEGRAFRRDEMVYLSYKALFATAKGSELTLAEKLGKGDVPKVVFRPEVTMTIRRELDPTNTKYVKYFIDRKQLPAEYSDFTYLGAGTVYWSFPTTNEIMHYLNPDMTLTGTYLSPYDPNDFTYHSMGKNSIVSLFDQDKKMIGFFDIMNNDKTGSIQVKLIPVKPISSSSMSIPQVTTGLSVSSNGELVVNRSGLPALVKNYAKIAFADIPVTEPGAIVFQGNVVASSSATKYYTASTIDLLNVKVPIGNKLNVYFFDGENKIIGYSLIDAKAAIVAMQKKLLDLGIREIKSGIVAANGDTFLIRSELDYPNPEKLVYWSTGNITYDYSPVAMTLLNTSRSYGDYRVISLNGTGGLTTKMVNNLFIVNFYDKDKKLIAYSVVTKEMINARKDIIKNVDVYYTGQVNSISNSHFTVQYYKDGKMVDSRTVSHIGLLNDPVKGHGVKLINVAIDPKENYELKVVSNIPELKVTEFEVK